MSEAVKVFKAKVKELAAFVESNEADSYLSEDFLARLTELRELTDIIRIDLAKERKVEAPIFAPNSVYIPSAPTGENLAAFVPEAAPVETPKAKVEKKTEPEVVVEPVVEEVKADDTAVEGPTDEVAGETPAKTTKSKSKA